MASQYSKWWWLGYFGVQSWTVEERRARIVLTMTWLVSFLAAMLVVSTALAWLGLALNPTRGLSYLPCYLLFSDFLLHGPSRPSFTVTYCGEPMKMPESVCLGNDRSFA
jgi:hypothetical protein